MSIEPVVGHDDDILIVGAGVFGLSTALVLRKRGYTNVTVLDRMLPPVPDGSSCDISRIIRNDYIDRFYADLATEAIQEWRSSDFSRFYHNTGYALIGQGDRNQYLEDLKRVQQDKGQELAEFDDSAQLVRMFPCLAGIGSKFAGYVNPGGAWADAAGAIGLLAARCSEAGVSFITGARGTVRSLKISNSRISGVKVASGPSLSASKVILAAGAWTNHVLDLSYALSGTAQPIGFIQLTPGEAKRLAGMPVVMNTSTGFFIFPPAPATDVLKVAIHGHGFETRELPADGTERVISSPKLNPDTPRATSFMPDSADRALRRGLRDILPQFADRPWERRRLCWYTDTPEADFVVDHHPSIQGLFVATGGSGQ